MKSNFLQQLFTLMKYSLLIIIVQSISLNLLLADNVHAQKSKSIRKVSISIESSQTDLYNVLKEIESKTDYKFAYNNSRDLEKIGDIHITSENSTVYEVLQEIAQQTGLDFKQVDQTINISRARLKSGGEVEISIGEVQLTITGQVTDETGAALPGATIVVKSTTNGTTTDVDGYFKINASEDAVLVVTFVGYEVMEIPVNNRSVIDVQLTTDATQLEELVVVGYGSKRKADITSAVSVVDMKDMGDQPVANATQFLRGKAAGVSVAQTDGTPGQEMSIMIRGVGSLGTNQAPLFVIDGFPVGNQMGNLNPDDIESITVLKDAASTAIYGARGSNGVVLVTTKRAKEGEVSVSASINYGFQNIPESKRIKMMTGQQYAQWRKEQFIDKSVLAGNGIPTIDQIPENYRYPEQTQYSTDWFDEIVNDNAAFQNYNVTLASGKGDVKTLVSAGYLSQEGAIIKTNFERYNLRANIDGKVNDFLTMGLNVVGSRSNERFINTTGRDAIIGTALWADPRFPVYNPDGSFVDYIGGDGGTFGSVNPVMELTQEKNMEHLNNLLSNAYVELSFLEDFKFRTSYNVSLSNGRDNRWRPSTLAGGGFNQPPPRNATLSEEYTEVINWSADQLLSYSKKIDAHQFDIMLGYSAQEQTVRSLSGSGNTFPDDIVQFLNNSENFNVGSDEESWSLLAYFVRANYSFKDKYLLSATFRREGSSRFGKNNLWGNFPAFSAGWRLSEESFITDINWISDLKLRASYGVTGNNNINEYQNSSNMITDNYIIGNQLAPGQRLAGFVNTNLGWEQSNQVDIGMDFSAFEGKLNLTVEWYNKITEDMLLSAPLPIITGFGSTLTNLGKVENKGVEVAVGYRTKVANDLNIHADFNISFNRNKVLAINGENDEIFSYSFYGTSYRSAVGRPIGMMWGYDMIGIFNSQAEIDASPTQDGAIPGTFIYRDLNNDGEITYGNTSPDMGEMGNPHPDFIAGLTIGADYKGFDLNILFTGAYDYDIARQIEKTTLNMDGVFNILAEAVNRWKSPEDPGNGWIPTSSTWKWQRETSSRYVSDGSHVWLRNITLGYTLPNDLPVLGGTRFYANADNLALWTKYPGSNVDIDRGEGRNLGNDDEAYPLPRIFTFGASINF